jgi:uncharacterized membrane protein
MTSDTHEPSLAELCQRVERLEAMVESLVAASSAKAPAAKPTPVQVKDSTHKTDPRVQNFSDGERESLRSAKFLGAVGVLCFILAGSYFIKLAIAQGWITPTMQLMAVVAFALSLIVAGFALRDSDTQYASLLPASGVVLLYMAAYGGHLYFHLYDGSVAGFIVNAVSIAALILYSSFRQHFYALAASVGTYLVPLLIGSASWSFLPLCLYVAVWNITYCVIAASLGSRMLLGLTAYFAVLLVALFGEPSVGANLYNETFRLAVFQALQFLFFGGMIAWYSIKRREPLSSSAAWSFFPLLLLFYASEYELIASIHPTLAPWCALGFAAWVIFVYAFARSRFGSQTLESYPMVSCFLAIVALHSVYMELCPSILRPLLALALLAYYARHVSILSRPSPHQAAVTVMMLIPSIEYVRVLLGQGMEVSPSYGVLLNIAFAAALFYVSREATKTQSSTALPLGALGAVQFLLALERVSALAFEMPTAGYVASALWSATALAVLMIALRRNDRGLAGKASWLFGVTALKVLFSDLSGSGTGERVIALIVIGALFYAGGFVGRQIGNRSS